MVFEFSCDYSRIRKVLIDPRSWRRMVNDASPNPEDFIVAKQDGIQYVLGLEGGTIVAVFVLLERGLGVEIHLCICPETWGDSVAIVGGFLKWLGAEPHFDVLYGPVPSYNRLALKLAQAVGFVMIGKIEQVGTRRGKPYDIMLLEYQKQRVLGAVA